jgi:hypothetical protein
MIEPKTQFGLLDVSRRAQADSRAFDLAVREFLDSFYADPASRCAAIEQRPEPIDALYDAYLAAVAEHLARSFHLPVPEWSEMHGNALTRPFFAGALESLMAILTVESPAAFRRRLIFVSKDALSRPRRATGAPGEAQRNATFTTS